jgi:hypothetical protein
MDNNCELFDSDQKLTMSRCHEWFDQLDDYVAADDTVGCYFSLDLNTEQQHIILHVAVDRTPTLAPNDHGDEDKTSFIEGLWTGDCGELFLCNPVNGFYIEFNLSPLGSWWCCAFTSPLCRKEHHPTPLAGVTSMSSSSSSSSRAGSSGWTAQLVIPLGSLPPELQFDPDVTTGNVCFCLPSSVATGVPRDLFYTHVRLRDDEGHPTAPNFHLPQKWRCIFSKNMVI